MLEKLPLGGFEWVKETSQFNEDLIKATIKIVMKDIF